MIVWRSLCFAICPRREDVAFPFIGDMADKLKTPGHPENEIAFIQDYDADDAKLALSVSVRAGKVRVLFGQHTENGFLHETSKSGIGGCSIWTGVATG